MMVTAVAPAENINAIVSDFAKGWRDRFVIAHPATVGVIRTKKEDPLKVKPNGMSAFGGTAEVNLADGNVN